MRIRRFVVPLALCLVCAPPALGQPRKGTTSAAARKGKPPAKPAPSAEAGGTDNPYGAEAPAEPAAATPEKSAAEAPPPSSGDPKLDEPPPPQTAETGGTKLSPLTPEANEFAKGPPPPGPEVFDKLMADIATLRARVAALTTSLFSSKLKISARTEGDESRIVSLAVTLDDGIVFQSGAGFFAEDDRIIYEHAVAPGSHVVGVEIERQDARGASYRTWQTSRFAISVPERKALNANLVLEDDSDMADDFPDDQDGEYELDVSLRATVQE